jgi:hypothetical protein
MLKAPSVNVLAKACLFVRINEWKEIEYQAEVEKQRQIQEQKRQEALKAAGIHPQGFNRV